MESFLRQAAKSGDLDALTAEIEKGIDLQHTQALILAARHGKEPCVRALIDAGCNLDLANNRGDNALILAARYGKEPCVRALIDAGCNLDLANNGGENALILAAQYGKE